MTPRNWFGKRAPLLAALALAGLCAAGCHPDGRAVRAYDVGYDKAWAATCATVESLRLSVEDKKQDGLIGTIKARRADDIVVRFSVRNNGEKASQISVRAGLCRPQASEQILNEIDRRLRR